MHALMLLALVFCLYADAAGAASLSLASTEGLYLRGLGVVGSDGSQPIPVAPYPGLPLSDVAVTQGSMTLNGNELGFSFSVFSDESPAVLRGSYGSYEAAVELRINEIRYESPVAQTVPGSPTALEGSVTGTLRGTLRVGTSLVAFTIVSEGGWYSDGAPPGILDVRIDADRVILGYTDGLGFPGGIASGLGVFPATDLLTYEGVTFGLPAIYPEFFTLVYVPEPSPAALLAFAGAALLGLRLARQRARTRRAMLPAAFLGA